MDLTHSLRLAADLDHVWEALGDLEQLSACFPGLTLTDDGPAGFSGSVKVKLGPMALAYVGSGRVVERDQHAHRIVIEAHGDDRRGNGSAELTLTATLAPAEEGGHTEVAIGTRLTVTGKPAQLGPEVVADVSQKLLDQLGSCVSSRLRSLAPLARDDAAAEPEDALAGEQVISGPAQSLVSEQPLEPPAEPPSVSGAVSPNGKAAPAADGVGKLGAAAPSSAGAARLAASKAARRRPLTYTPPRDTSQTDLQALAHAVPRLVKRYGPALGAGSLLLVVALRLARRIRHR